MLQRTARSRRTRHNQIVIALLHFLQELIDNKTVPDADLDGDAKFFERLLFRAQIATEPSIGTKQGVDVFLEFKQMRVNGRWFGHDMKQCDLGMHCSRDSAGQPDGGIDIMLAPATEKNARNPLARSDRN